MKQHFLYIACAALFIGCDKEPTLYSASELFTFSVQQDTVNADGWQRLEVTVQLLGDRADIDLDQFVFTASSGTWINSTGAIVPGDITATAGNDGIARVIWQSGRHSGGVTLSAVIKDTEYRQSKDIVALAAFPDTIVLSTPALLYDSAGNHLATIRADLFSEPGEHSVDLPLIFRAWQRQGGDTVEVGTFVTPSLQFTNSGPTYTINLELNVPGLLPLPDTINVRASCGSVQSRVLHLFYRQ